MSSRKKYIVFKIIELISLLTPIIILACIRFDKWFIKQEQVDVFNISFGFILCIIVVFFLLKGYAKRINGIIWCLILFLMTYFLKGIIEDSYMILGMALAGLVMSYPFKILSIKNKELARIVRDEYERVYVRNKAQEEIDNRG